ncbi:MAG: caspase family protein, partial [Proteobacteria bacterium]|nr:caspase family protein [Pseudomonadota bacterium]
MRLFRVLASCFLFVASLAAGWPDLSSPPPEAGGGEEDAAVIVGIEDYVFVDDVLGARANAEDWYRYLTRTRRVPPGRIVLLRDHEGTDAQIRQAVHRAVSMVESKGTLWFLYIGHGAPAKDGKDGLLVGADAQQSAVGIYSRSVARSEIVALLAEGKQANAVMMLDSCFSGKTAGGSLAPDLQPLVPTYAIAATKGVTVFTGAASDQFAGPLPGVRRPAYSYLLLGALRGWGDKNGDGQVTAREASDYAKEALLATLRDRIQEPQLEGAETDFVLANATEAGPDLIELALGKTASAPLIEEIQVSAPEESSPPELAPAEEKML